MNRLAVADKVITFELFSARCWGSAAQGNPNSGVIMGDKFIRASDAGVTPGLVLVGTPVCGCSPPDPATFGPIWLIGLGLQKALG